jgi:hypothetical protein
MPLFRRCDGELVTPLSDVRRIMPYLMRGRNESVVYHVMEVKIAKTRARIRQYNQIRQPCEHATLFHAVVYVLARLLHDRPGINRFVAGGRIYQRKNVCISFVVKKRMAEDAPLVTIKLPFPPNEPFDDCVKRINEAISQARSDSDMAIDRELRVLTRLPGPVLRSVFAAGRWLDRLNLLPAALIEPDPMYTSLFAANLGSVSGSNAFHHLYEWGTCSLFAVMGNVKKKVVVGRRGQTEECDVLDLYCTFDERINDGFYVFKALALSQQLFKNPERWIGPPSEMKKSGVETMDSADRIVSPQA